MRYFFHIGYHGYPYRGWQRQAGVVSVQEVLENVLARILKTPVTVMGCGRTDAQVNASQYFFHIDVAEAWDFDLLFRLNKVLPDTIAIFDIIPVQDNQHARFDATQRTYDYFIHTYKDPFLSTLSALYLQENWDLEQMKAAVALFPQYTNYHGFCRSPEKHNSTICQVSSAALYVDANGDRLRFQISANRFLKAMIRILMGKVMEIGRGEFTVAELEHCLKTGGHPPTIIPAHPQGLYLSKITYPFLDLPPRAEFSGILQNRADVRWQLV